MFDMQNLTFFVEGNTFTGSRSQGDALLRYRVAPDKENGQLLAWRWQEDKCFERADSPEQKAFPFDEPGLAAIQSWLASLWPEMPEEPAAEE